MELWFSYFLPSSFLFPPNLFSLVYFWSFPPLVLSFFLSFFLSWHGVRADPNKHIVLTKWQSRKHLNEWMANPEYKELVTALDKVMQSPAKYHIMETPKEDIFLL